MHFFLLSLTHPPSVGNVEVKTACLVAMGMAFVPATTGMLLSSERCGGCKHLQAVSGLNGLVYWTATLISDMVPLNFTLPSIHLLLILKTVCGFCEHKNWW